MGKRKIYVGVLLILVVCLLEGILLPEKQVLAAAGDGVKESLEFLNEVTPQQFTNLDGLVITEEQYEEIRTFTEQITEGTATEEEKIEIIYSFVTSGQKGAQHPDYVLQEWETENDPYPVFAKRCGVCYGRANLCRVMCTAVNIPCINVDGNYCSLDGNEYAHVWNFVYCDGKWCFLDATLGNIDLKGSEDLWQYYDVGWFEAILAEENGYQISYDEGLAVIGYNGDDTDLVIPETCRDGKWTITAVDCLVPEGNIGNARPLIRQGVESLVLPKTVTNILKINSVRIQTLREITVDSDNPVYSSYGGVVYNKAETEIIYIPLGIEVLDLKKTGVLEKNTLYGLTNLKILKLAEGTTELQGWAVENCPNLESVYIPDSVEMIDSQAFADCGTEFTVYASEGSAGAIFAEANGIKTEVPDKTDPDDKDPDDTVPDKTDPDDKGPADTDSDKTIQDNTNSADKEPEKTEPNKADTYAVKLKKVKNLRVKYKANKKIILSWKKDKEAGGYEIYRFQGKKWVRIKKVGKKTRVTIARGSAKKYQYKVRAYKKVGGKTYYGVFSKKLKVRKK